MTGQDIALNAADVESRCASVGSRTQDGEADTRQLTSTAEQAISDASGGSRSEVDRFLTSAEGAARQGLAAVDAIRNAMTLAAAQMAEVDAAAAARVDAGSGPFARIPGTQVDRDIFAPPSSSLSGIPGSQIVWNALRGGGDG